MKNAAAIVGGVLVLAGVAGIFALRDGGGDSGPPTPGPSPATLDEPEAPDGRPIEILCRRSRDEILLFARRREFGRPASGIEIRILGADGTVLRIGRTDQFGVLRASLPADAVQVAHVGDESGKGATFLDVPAAPPPAPPPSLPVLADRSVVRPGDIVRFCVWAEGAPEGVLSFEPEDPAVERVRFSEVEELQAGFPGPRKHWILLEACVPDEVRPGTAIATVGTTRIEFPLLPRFGPPLPVEERPAPSSPEPRAGAKQGDPSLEFRDGTWRVESREEIVTALFYAVEGDRFRSHVAVVGDGTGAATSIPVVIGRTATPRIVALVSTISGFSEASAAVEMPAWASNRLRIEAGAGAPGGPPGDFVAAYLTSHVNPSDRQVDRASAPLAIAMDDPSGASPDVGFVFEDRATEVRLPFDQATGGDRVVRALACPLDGGPSPLHVEWTVLAAHPPTPPSGPAWIYEGDVVAGVERQPPTRPAMLQVGRFVQPGESVRLWDPGFESPEGGEVLLMLPVRETRVAVRVRVGGAIVLETAAGPQPVEHLLDAASLAAGPIEVECPGAADDEGFAAYFTGEFPVRPSAVSPTPAFPAAPFDIARELPARVVAGQVADLKVRVRCAPDKVGDALLVIRCPLPRGAVPAEDAWAVRDRMPSPDGSSGPTRGDALFVQGSNVWLTDEAVIWFLDRPAREVDLTLRVRFPWKGRFTAPPATAKATGTRLPHARTAGSVVVVE